MITLTAIFLSVVCISSLYILLKQVIRKERLHQIETLKTFIHNLHSDNLWHRATIKGLENTIDSNWERIQRQTFIACTYRKQGNETMYWKHINYADQYQTTIQHDLQSINATKLRIAANQLHMSGWSLQLAVLETKLGIETTVSIIQANI